jgi:hypothetical protein
VGEPGDVLAPAPEVPAAPAAEVPAAEVPVGAPAFAAAGAGAALAGDGIVAVVAEAAAPGDGRPVLWLLGPAGSVLEGPVLGLPPLRLPVLVLPAAAVAVPAPAPAGAGAPPLPRLEQPAVIMTAASPATAVSRYRRPPMPCLPPLK